jgi:hypothetical protein
MINYGTVTSPTYRPGHWVAKVHPLLLDRRGEGVRDSTAPGFGTANVGWGYAYAYATDISFLPDHAHESQCFELSDDGPDEKWCKPIPTAAYSAFGRSFEEFGPSWQRIPAEMVALAVAGGRAVSTGTQNPDGTYNGQWKPPVMPRVFGAASAFDGHDCNKYITVPSLQNQYRPGRVVCDSTWHHYVNANLNGAGTGREPGLYSRAPLSNVAVPTFELRQIFQYYRNILMWLQPYEYSTCLLTLGLTQFRKNGPLMHEVADHLPIKSPMQAGLVGQQLIAFFNINGGAMSAEQLARQLLIKAERWQDFAPLLDIRHHDATPLDPAAILQFGFGRAFAAHVARFAQTLAIDKAVAEETATAHAKTEAVLLKAFVEGCQEGVKLAISDASGRASLLKELAKPKPKSKG